MSKPNRSEKGLPHFKLEEALREEGCAICRLVDRAEHGYLDNLLYELVNDGEVQKQFRESLGFCNRHAHSMLRVGDGLGTAILYRTAVQELLDKLSKLSEPSASGSLLAMLPGRGSGTPQTLPEPGGDCMVCEAERNTERRYLKVLVEGAADGSLEDFLHGPGTVCVRHLSRASKLTEERLPPELVRITEDALRELEDELGRYVKHTDHRFKDDPWGTERDSWIRAVSTMVGERRK